MAASAWNVSTQGGLDAQSLEGSSRLARPIVSGRTEARWLSTQEIVQHREKMATSVADGSLSRIATEIFRKIDREGSGVLAWNSGAIREFITQVLCHYELHSPPEGQVYQLYSAFDRDKNGSLTLSESLRLVEAIVRAAFNIKFEARSGSVNSLAATLPASKVPVQSNPLSQTAPPLAQLATQALPTPSGAPVLPPSRGMRLAQEWISGYKVQPLSQTRLAYAPGLAPLDITNFSGNFRTSAEANASSMPRLKASLENLTLIRGALDTFQVCDRERKGFLTWDAGEVHMFVSRVFQQHGLVPPTQEQVRNLFVAFDLDHNGRLEPREGMCMVDALARAIVLAQPPSPKRGSTQTSARPMGTVSVPAYSVAEEWLASHRPQTLDHSTEVSYDGTPVNLRQLWPHVQSVLGDNARHRGRMKHAIESGELLKEAMRLFKECDRDRNGMLTWNEGEIRKFISEVFKHYDLVVPAEAQLYEIYRHFDRDSSYSLDVRESLCFVDAMVRAMFLDVSQSSAFADLPQADRFSPGSRLSGSPSSRLSPSNRVSPQAGTGSGSHSPRRRPVLTDEEAARRVANQEARMDHKVERLIRSCGDAISRRICLATLHVVFGAWRQEATKQLFARTKEGWDRHCHELKEELARAAQKAESRLQQEKNCFEERLEEELERYQQRRVLDTTASVVSAVAAAEAAAEAEEEAERRFLKERHLWESRVREERQQRERMEKEHSSSLQQAEAQGEEKAEARFREERLLFEERLKEERERRVRAEAAKAQVLDHWAEEARKLKKNAVQKIIDSWLPKNTKERALRQLKEVLAAWVELAKAGGRRRRRITAIDKAVMSWGRKALSGRPGPSFHAWRRLARGRGRAHAVVGVLQRQWLGGSRAGLMVSALSEWRRLLAQKRQDALRAKRRAKAHAQVGLLLAQWERGQDVGLLSSCVSAWHKQAAVTGKKRSKERRHQAVQLALDKWQRGATKGLLHSIVRSWRTRYVGRRRQARLLSSYLVLWEEKAEVGLQQTCLAAWKKLADASARSKSKKRGQEAVKLALEKFLRGNQKGLLHETLAEWFKASVAKRQKVDLVRKSLMSWEQETGVGVLKTCTSAWKRLTDATALDKNRRRGKEAVALALQKFTRGDAKGLAHEVLDQWYKLAILRRRQAAIVSNFLVSWEVETEVGLLQTCASAWRRLSEAGAKKRSKERQREAVHLSVQRWLYGQQKGLAKEILSLWRKLCEGRRHVELVNRCLVSWEEETGVGLLHTFLLSWWKQSNVEKQKQSKERAKEAVRLAVEKWEMGNVRGLLHEILSSWHRLHVGHGRQAEMLSRYLVSWEVQAEVGLIETCLAAWKKVADAEARKRSKEQGHEAVKLALQKFERGNAKGILHEVISEWHRVGVEKKRQAEVMGRYMLSWESKANVGVLGTCMAEWKKVVDALARQKAKEQKRESVKLALQKWERGSVAGLLHEVVSQWRKLMEKEHSREAVQLALQKWERGNVQGLLHEILSQWHQHGAGQKKKAKTLGRYLLAWESKAGVALQGTCFASWRQEAQELGKRRAKERTRESVQLALQKWERGNINGLLHEALQQWRKLMEKEHGREAVKLALQKWERGNIQGLLHEVLSQWQQLAGGRAKKARMLDRYLLAWESKAGVGLQSSFLALWKQMVDASKRAKAKVQGREAVKLALQKWERGKVEGLLHEVVAEWHHVAARNKQKARMLDRCLLAWESKSGVGLMGSFLALWKQQVDADKRIRTKKKGHEAVMLALQKWERGNAQGLLAEVLSTWKTLMRKDSAKGAVELLIQRWARGADAGLLAEILSVWRQLCKERKAASKRDRAHEAVMMMLHQWRRPGAQGMAACALSLWGRLALKSRGRAKALKAVESQIARYLLGKAGALRAAVVSSWRQAAKRSHARASVELVMRQWDKGKLAGIASAALSEWRKAQRRQKAHASVELLLRQWEQGMSKGLQTTVLGEWQRLVQEYKGDLKRQRAHAVVELTLSQWEKGQAKGLMATVVKDWHKYTEVTASNGRRIRGAGTLEEKLLLSLLQLCLHGWSHAVAAERGRSRSQALRESLQTQRLESEEVESMLLLNLVFAVWQLCVMEPKRDQAFQQLTETSAIAFQLQEDNTTLQSRLTQVMETLQRELQTKEELAAELREAYSKQVLRAPLLPDLPGGLVLPTGSPYSARAAADVAASVASISRSSHPTDAEDCPNCGRSYRKNSDVCWHCGCKRGKVRSPGRSQVNGGEHCDWDVALPRVEELMKSLEHEGKGSKGSTPLTPRTPRTPKESFAERLQDATREEEWTPVEEPTTQPSPTTPTSAAAARRRRLAAERAGRFGDAWL